MRKLTTVNGKLPLIITNLDKLRVKKMRIKPTMSHVVNGAHLNELLIKWYKEENKELRDALSFAKDHWTHNEPSESVMSRYFDELEIK